jgi:hypothetical protein
MSAIRSRRSDNLTRVELRVCTLATPRGRLWAVGTARAVEERVDCASCPTLARLHEVRAPDNAGPALLPPPRSVPRVPNLLERHPEVREVLGSRLAEANGFSGRETKRFLSVWQFYLRVAINTLPDMNLQNGIKLASDLVFACEIIVRWPAHISHLCREVDGEPLVRKLATVVNNDFLWASTLGKASRIGSVPDSTARDLRSLLRSAPSVEVAELTLRLV